MWRSGERTSASEARRRTEQRRRPAPQSSKRHAWPLRLADGWHSPPPPQQQTAPTQVAARHSKRLRPLSARGPTRRRFLRSGKPQTSELHSDRWSGMLQHERQVSDSWPSAKPHALSLSRPSQSVQLSWKRSRLRGAQPSPLVDVGSWVKEAEEVCVPSQQTAGNRGVQCTSPQDVLLLRHIWMPSSTLEQTRELLHLPRQKKQQTLVQPRVSGLRLERARRRRTWGHTRTGVRTTRKALCACPPRLLSRGQGRGNLPRPLRRRWRARGTGSVQTPRGLWPGRLRERAKSEIGRRRERLSLPQQLRWQPGLSCFLLQCRR
mmetsp:Transcript_865/g.2334  ORF Transcript_865/g.2334 Transcript_865/m.2334 type:complete len:320 (+) Transcript_865:1220-2179(+)